MHRSSVGTLAFICIAGGALFALLFDNYYPGMVNADSMDMLCQAVHNQFHDWHSPLMSLIWRYLDKIVPGPPLMLALIQAGYVLSACLLAVQLSQNQWQRVAYVALLVFWPPLFAQLGMVTKDSMCLWISLLFIVSLYELIKDPRHSMLRLAVVVVLALFGIAIRLDATAFFVAGLALAYYLMIDSSHRSALKHGKAIFRGIQLVIASAAAVVTIIICVGLISVFNSKIMHATPRLAIQTTLIHDIADISIKSGQNFMPDYVLKSGVDLPLLTERYTARYSDPLFFTQTRNIPIGATPVEFKELWTSWRAAVVAHPIEYFRHRMATFVYLLDIAQPNPSEVYQGHTGANAGKYCSERAGQNLDDPRGIGLSLFRDDAMPKLLNTFMFRGYAYDVTGLSVLFWTLRRLWKRGNDPIDGRDQLIITIAVGAGLHQLALFFSSPAALFRYLTPTILSCVIIILLLSSRHKRISQRENR